MAQRTPSFLIAVGVLAVAAALAFWLRGATGRPFDPKAWRADERVGDGVRQEMADRIVARQTLRGKSRAEVVDMLGEPPPHGNVTGWDMAYWLGLERGFIRLDSEWLIIRLGQDGRVQECRIYRD